MSKLTRQQFIAKLAPYAIKDMQITNVPASLTIAQGILESADGNSTLTVQANNLFGIKGMGTKGTIEMLTTEYISGVPHRVNAKFRVYNDWGESVADHSTLFLNGVSWNRQLYHGVIGKDGITAAYEVAKAGYATDPNYSNKLIKLIQENDLLKFDKTEQSNNSENLQVSESTRISELEEKVRIIVDDLTKLSDRLKQIPAPEWFTSEFPNALELLNQKTGTIDFWRAFAVTLRIANQNNFTNKT